MCIWSVSFHTSCCPTLTLTHPSLLPSICFTYSSYLQQNLALSWSKCYCHHVLATLSYHIHLLLWGWPRVYCGCRAIGRCQNKNSLIKKTIMLPSTLHYFFKDLCEHYLINHHNSSGEDKHCWLSYLDHILKELFFFLVIVWLCYEIWIGIVISAIWI